MFAIIVTEKGGDQRRLEFDKSEVTIGRVQGNDIVLPKGNVSKRHARIVLKDGKFIIVDLKSTNGTYVNGRKITSPLVVKENDKIYVGDFIVGVQERAGGGGYDAEPEPRPPGPPPAPAPIRAPEPPPPAPPPPAPPRPEPPRAAPPPPARTAPPAPARTAPPPARTAPPAPPARTAPPAPARTAPPAPARTAPPAPVARPASGPSSAPARQRLVGAGARRAQSAGQSAPQSAARQDAPRRAAPPKQAPAPAPAPGSVPGRAVLRSAAPRVQIEPLDPQIIRMLDLQSQVLDRAAARLDLDSIPMDALGDEDLWQRAESAIVDLVETLDSAGEIPNYINQDSLIKEALNEALGLGPLEDLLADTTVEEVVVDRRDRILVNRGGDSLVGSGKAFSSDEAFQRVVERLVAPTGYAINEETPLVNVRLRDGSRLTAAVPPVAVNGVCFTLRKPRSASHTLQSLIDGGVISAEIADFLTTCVSARRNVLVCGGGNSGRADMVSALANAAPVGERIVSVEEVAELSIDRDDWVALEARPGDANGRSDVGLDAVLRGALRMRPDRLVVGDVRGMAAMELVAAMASSCDGAIVAIGGDGARAGLARLTSMARLAVPGASVEALRDLAGAALDVAVHVVRFADGSVRVASVDEILGATAEGVDVRQLFRFAGVDAGFAAAGVIPEFYAELDARGMPADTSIFRT